MALPPEVIAATDKAAAEHNLPARHVAAVVEVESGGHYFYQVNGQRMPAVLFEPHILFRRTSGPAQDELVAAGLASAKWDRSLYPRSQAGRWMQITDAAGILEHHGQSKDAAYESASYGVGQVMGYHWKALGFASMNAFLEAMLSGIDGQIDVMLKFIKENGLDDELREGQWAAFARGYNGPAFRQNQYDTKLAEAAGRQGGVVALPNGMLRMGSKGRRVRELQTLLQRAGHQVQVDGEFGPATRDQLQAFQRKHKLKVDGVYGPKTEAALAQFRQSVTEKPGHQNVTEISEVKQGAGGAVIGAGIELAQGKIDEATAGLQNVTGFDPWLGYGLTALSVLAAVVAIAGIAWALKGWLSAGKTVEA